jgi:hypothetical protein
LILARKGGFFAAATDFDFFWILRIEALVPQVG